MAYSMDLRSKVLEAVDEGRATKSDIAHVFGVSRQWINQVLRRRRAVEDGTFAGLKKRGPKAKLGPAEEARLRDLHAAKPDATVEEFHRRLGAPVCAKTVWNGLRRLGLTFKKRP